jgi:serine/threonine protein kinase
MTSGLFPEFPKGHILTAQNSYEIIQPFKTGGFGTTYLARDTSYDETDEGGIVIVKQLNPHNSCPIEDAERCFRKEAQALRQLGNKHNRIPDLLFSSFSQPYFYLILEYIEGNNLREEFDTLVQKKKSWDEQKAREFLVDTLQTLDFMHGNNFKQITIIHRDLKPENLIRRETDQKIVIVDFGIVKIISGLETGKPETYTTLLGKSRPYTAPEIEAINPVTVRGSDLYSLGVITIEFLTGKTISQLSVSTLETVHQIWHRVKDQFDPSLGNLVSRMVHQEYDDNHRFQTAQEVLIELGVDTIPILYQRLYRLLSQQQWQNANDETNKIIRKVAQETSIPSLNFRGLGLFPRETLRKLDELWMEQSGGHYGFSIQRKILEEHHNNCELLGQLVGWKNDGKWLNIEALRQNSSEDCPQGYFPFVESFFEDDNSLTLLPERCERLFSRISI